MTVSIRRMTCAVVLSLVVALPAPALEGMAVIASFEGFDPAAASVYIPGRLKLLYLSTMESSFIVSDHVNGASFSPDGYGISFSRAGKICKCDLLGDNVVELADCASEDNQVATTWASDGYIYLVPDRPLHPPRERQRRRHSDRPHAQQRHLQCRRIA
jgi:hypothetical protein